MDHRLIEGLMEAIAPLIKTHIDKRIAEEVAPLRAKLAEYESSAKELRDNLVDKDGVESLVLAIADQKLAIRDAAQDETIREMVEEAVAKIEVKDGRDGSDGKSVDVVDLIQVIEAEVQHAVGAIEPPKDGKDGVDGADGKSVTVDDVRPMIEELFSALPVPQNGKDADPAEVAALIVEDVAKLIPPPADGKSVTVEEVLPFLQEMVDKGFAEIPVPKDGKDGADGRDGKDGVGLAGALLGRSGELVVTLSDGSTKDLGVIVGKDGEPGTPGTDGKDGVGFDDLDATYDGERTIAIKFARGDNVKEFAFRMPVVLDRGVFKENREAPYEKGDGVTFGGSFWIAQKDSPEGKPQDGSKDWRLSVKRGRNGADGVVRQLAPQGPVKI